MTNEPQLFQQLAQRLSRKSLPPQVRARWAPELSYGRHEGPPAWDARRAAVMLLLYRREEKWQLALTRRLDSLPAHAGQISLPGGQIEPGETPEQAAARELWEELGVGLEGLSFLGRLSPIYVFASNYDVTPCVAGLLTEPQFRLNPAEVANVIEVPLVRLQDSACLGRHVISRGSVEFTAPHFDLSGDLVWGATSMVLAELLAILPENVE